MGVEPDGGTTGYPWIVSPRSSISMKPAIRFARATQILRERGAHEYGDLPHGCYEIEMKALLPVLFGVGLAACSGGAQSVGSGLTASTFVRTTRPSTS